MCYTPGATTATIVPTACPAFMWTKNPATVPPTAAASWSRWPSGYAKAAMDGCGKPQPKTKRPLCRRIALRHSGFFATYGDDSDYIPCAIKSTRNSLIFLTVSFLLHKSAKTAPTATHPTKMKMPKEAIKYRVALYKT